MTANQQLPMAHEWLIEVATFQALVLRLGVKQTNPLQPDLVFTKRPIRANFVQI